MAFDFRVLWLRRCVCTTGAFAESAAARVLRHRVAGLPCACQLSRLYRGLTTWYTSTPSPIYHSSLQP